MCFRRLPVLLNIKEGVFKQFSVVQDALLGPDYSVLGVGDGWGIYGGCWIRYGYSYEWEC